MTNSITRAYICQVIGSLTVGFSCWVGFFAYGVCSWRSEMTNQNVKKCLRAWVRMGHGGPLAFASNVAIFLSVWVTCTSYLHPLGYPCDTLGVIGVSPGGVTPIISILTEKSRHLCQNYFLFDIYVFCTYNLCIKTSFEQQQSTKLSCFGSSWKVLDLT